MKYRCHVYAIVRIEHECDAETPQQAAWLAADKVVIEAHDLFNRPGMSYAEDHQPEVVVDPLTEERDPDTGRLLADVSRSVTVKLDD